MTTFSRISNENPTNSVTKRQHLLIFGIFCKKFNFCEMQFCACFFCRYNLVFAIHFLIQSRLIEKNMENIFDQNIFFYLSTRNENYWTTAIFRQLVQLSLFLTYRISFVCFIPPNFLIKLIINALQLCWPFIVQLKYLIDRIIFLIDSIITISRYFTDSVRNCRSFRHF